MAGAPVVGAFIARWGFWILLVIGVAAGELRIRGAAVFLGLWLAGRFALASVLYGGLVTPYIAVLDIALVFVVFKGDVRLT